MSCPCKCENFLDYCEQDVCGEIDFDVLVQTAGIHKLILDYLGNQLTLSSDLGSGDKIVFDISNLNENFQYTGEIYDPSGARVVITKDSVEYDCVRFKTQINIAV